MTRFARAKGSKSSNERLPHESTPWHILKEHLERALVKEDTEKKTKSAKELLSEKELYYPDSVGNVAHDWADFENSKPKENNVKKGKVEKKSKEKKEKLKKVIKRTVKDAVTDESSVKIKSNKKLSKNKIDLENSNQNNVSNAMHVNSPNSESVNKKDKLNKKKNKQNNNVANAIDVNEPNSESVNKKDKLNKEKNQQNNNAANATNVNGPNSESINKIDKLNKKKNEQNNAAINGELKLFKNKKRKLSASKPLTKSENPPVTKNDNSAEPNTLSKRQKRNLKKQNQKSEICNKKDENTENSFNIEGNDWNTSIKFGKEKKFNGNKDGNGGPNKFQRRPWIEDPLDYKNFRRFGNNVPRKFQRKVAKPRLDGEYRPKKFEKDDSSKKVTINGIEVEIVKYDGYPIKKDDAERLSALRKEMVLKGIPKSDIDAAMKLERRKCEKALARIRKQVCFHCRKAGHNLSDCPELEKEEAGTGICFKCGSTEHTHFECKVNKSDDYRYAKCFICREQGHIAKQCPDNPKGLYPDGGSCKICGEVTHSKKDCPDLIKEKEETTMTLDTINDKNLEALENEGAKVNRDNKKTKKIVKF